MVDDAPGVSRVFDADALHVTLTAAPIDIGALQAHVADPAAGAVLSFVGTVRNSKQGKTVLGIDYEAYATMAEKALRTIAATMLSRWPVQRVAIVHRVGRLAVGDPSIAILLSTPHRAEGFEALRYGIEAVKSEVPIWKKERFLDGSVWVQEGS